MPAQLVLKNSNVFDADSNQWPIKSNVFDADSNQWPIKSLDFANFSVAVNPIPKQVSVLSRSILQEEKVGFYKSIS